MDIVEAHCWSLFKYAQSSDCRRPEKNGLQVLVRCGSHASSEYNFSSCWDGDFFTACISNHFAADSATDFKQKFFEQRPSCRMPILVTSKPLAKKNFSTVICWRSEQPTYSKQKSRVWSPKICKAFPLPTNSLGKRLGYGVLHWYYCSHVCRGCSTSCMKLQSALHTTYDVLS